MGVLSRRLSKDERNSYRDEQRLLLPGGRPKRDRGAVPVLPGSSAKSYETFKPINTIGVKPDTRINRASSISRPSFTTPKPPGLDKFTVIPDSDDEEATPPRKRLKRESPEIIDLESNDQSSIVPTSPSADILIEDSVPLTPVPEKKIKTRHTSKYWPLAENALKTPSPGAPRRKLWSGRMRDAFSDSDTGQPANKAKPEQNRSIGVDLQNKRTSKTGHSIWSVPEVVVKPPNAEIISKYPKEIDCSVNHRSLAGSDRGSYDSRESPDELQGNKTISDAWKERDTLRRNVSPSNIRHTRFTNKASQKTLSRHEEKKIKKKQTLVTFDISMFRYRDFLAKPLSRLTYNKETSEFSITSAGDALSSKTKTFNFMKAIRMHYGENADCGKVRLIFPQSQGVSSEFADIEFSSESEKEKFWDIIHAGSPSLKRHKKKKEWMEELFLAPQRSANTDKADALKHQKPKPLGATKEANFPSVQPKRMKLSANLGNGDESISSRPSEKLSHAHPSPSRPESTTSMPVRTYCISPIPRKTRSAARKQNLEISSNDEEEKPISTSIFDVPGKQWQNPLVYPAIGKKKAEVEAHDLDRLRPHEFLNDNLIGLYIRFLEHHLERQHPDFAKRVYFFNSYFFATLTNNSKNQKGINYQGVEKWTRSFNIFEFDYLVVPINENAHWYVAIICNLPSLFSSKVDDGLSGSENAGQQGIDTSEAKFIDVPSNITTGGSKLEIGKSASSDSEAANEGEIQESFTSMTLDDIVSGEAKEAEAAAAEDWPDEDENQPSPPTYRKRGRSFLNEAAKHSQPSDVTQPEQPSKTSKAAKKRGKKNRAPGIRYDVKQPAIIVFDSLDCPRRPTIGILREYLEEEAQAKRSLTIDSKEIVGMNAKQIPHQPNFSDCGLYLLAYLEKFVQNPDIFVKSVLRKEMNRTKDWPAMKPGLFRSRFRKFLLDLYEEQEALKNGKLKENESLIADAKSLNILLDELPAEDDRLTDEDKKGSDTSKVTPEPKPRRAVSEIQVTPTRSSPRHSRKGQDIPRSSSPKFPGSIIIPPTRSSMFSGFQDAISKQNEGSEEESIQVPMTPPPASPSVVVSSPFSLRSTLASSKQNQT
ncbi:putative Ulp1 peptidase [Microsporum audouinii]